MRLRRKPEWSIDEHARRFRDTVNIPEIHDQLVKRGKRSFEQLCASMDVLGDTEEALSAYFAGLATKHDQGTLYLITYGLLQALILQQDALTHAAESIGFRYVLTPELKDIREVRNNAIGHPTKRGRGPQTNHYGIMRISMDAVGFVVYSFDWDRKQMRNVQFCELIATQTANVRDTLNAMTKHLLDECNGGSGRGRVLSVS
jgi:hypothetical protein